MVPHMVDPLVHRLREKERERVYIIAAHVDMNENPSGSVMPTGT